MKSVSQKKDEKVNLLKMIVLFTFFHSSNLRESEFNHKRNYSHLAEYFDRVI